MRLTRGGVDAVHQNAQNFCGRSAAETRRRRLLPQADSEADSGFGKIRKMNEKKKEDYLK
jgi:hypothetical protein